MVFVTINRKEQVGNKSSIDLYHKPILASCNEVVNPQVTFPPSKKVFNFPSELINFSDLLSGQISAVSCNPVVDIINTVTDKTNSFLGLIVVLNTPQQNFGIIKNNALGLDEIFLNQRFGCIGFNPDHKAFAFSLQRIKRGMFLVATIAYASLARRKNLTDKRSFTAITISKI